MGQILYIHTRPDDQKPADRFVRLPLESAELVAGHGLKGDQKAGHHPDRQLNFITQEWLQDRAAEGYRTEPGQFGEQMIIQGLSNKELQPGTRLQLGSQAIIEITKHRTGCQRLETVQGKSTAGISSGIGPMARVLTGGNIRVGDRITVVLPVSSG